MNWTAETVPSDTFLVSHGTTSWRTLRNLLIDFLEFFFTFVEKVVRLQAHVTSTSMVETLHSAVRRSTWRPMGWESERSTFQKVQETERITEVRRKFNEYLQHFPGIVERKQGSAPKRRESSARALIPCHKQ